MAAETDGKVLNRIVDDKDMDGLMKFVEKVGIDAKVMIGAWTRPIIAQCAKHSFDAGVVRLIEDGADVCARGKCDFTALHVAESAAVVEALLTAGAEIDAKLTSGSTPLSSASYHGRNAVADALIEHGADVNAAQNSGWTPLMIASYRGHKHIALSLLAAGADTSVVNADGKTAEQCAADNGHTDIVAMIRGGREAARVVLAADKQAATLAAAAAARDAAKTALPPAEAVNEAAAAD
eukprot:PLAT3348.13.p2 GENE.PLAT3348.13~~PLAT3348.13.p2  ORF type:complete len:237 (+),score=56.19 PLAT3348.13:637-1347(+)